MFMDYPIEDQAKRGLSLKKNNLGIKQIKSKLFNNKIETYENLTWQHCVVTPTVVPQAVCYCSSSVAPRGDWL